MKQDLFAEEFPIEKPAPTLPVIKKGKVKLTSAQSEFNRLNKKIVLLKEDLNNLPEKKRRVREFYNQSVLPVERKSDRLFISLLMKWDERYDQKEFSDDDLFDLSGLILEKCRAITRASAGMDENDIKTVTDLKRKHEMIQFGLSADAFDKKKVKELLETFTLMTGFKPTAQMETAQTEEDAVQLIAEFLEQNTPKGSEEQPSKSEKQDPFDAFNSQQPEEAKQKRKISQTELMRKMQEERTHKSIRSIYMRLAKELHPDLEQDEALRMVKEDRMKQLTEAYQNSDLSALLTMQISWLQESVKTTPGELSDVVLKGYNKVLKTQLEKLEEEQCVNIYSSLDVPGDMYELLFISINQLGFQLNIHLSKTKSAFIQLERASTSWNTKKGLSKLIKEHQRKNELEDFLNGVFDDRGLEDWAMAMQLSKMKL